MKLEIEQKLKELMKLIDEHYHPHVTIIVTSTHAEVVEGVSCTQNKELRD